MCDGDIKTNSNTVWGMSLVPFWCCSYKLIFVVISPCFVIFKIIVHISVSIENLLCSGLVAFSRPGKMAVTAVSSTGTGIGAGPDIETKMITTVDEYRV